MTSDHWHVQITNESSRAKEPSVLPATVLSRLAQLAPRAALLPDKDPHAFEALGGRRPRRGEGPPAASGGGAASPCGDQSWPEALPDRGVSEPVFVPVVRAEGCTRRD